MWRGNVYINKTFQTSPIDWPADLQRDLDISFDFWVNAAHSSDVNTGINQKSRVNKSNYSSAKERGKSDL